jgi:hypothetical protein
VITILYFGQFYCFNLKNTFILTSEKLTEPISLPSFFPHYSPIFAPCVDDFTTYFPHELMASWLHSRQEDSLSSCRGLMPRPPRRDEQKLLVDADKAGAKTRGRLLWGALKWMILP